MFVFFFQMELLPRDLQLAVLSRADMDARRAMGIFFRLRVPERVRDALHTALGARRSAQGRVEVDLGAPGRTRYRLLRTAYATHTELHVVCWREDDDGGWEMLGAEELLFDV